MMRRLTKGCVGYQIINQIIADYGSLMAAPDESIYVMLEKLHQIHFGDLPEGAIYITSNGIFEKGESNSDYESADSSVSRD